MAQDALTCSILTADPLPPKVRKKNNTPGSGFLHLSPSPSRAQFSTLLASYPLKLLAPTPLPSQPSNLAICYTLAYGGGLVAGDIVSLKVDVDEGCLLVLLTQGSTKVFKHRPGLRPLSYAPLKPSSLGPAGTEKAITKQRLHIALKPDSLLLLLPDSVSPFRGSTYVQAQRFVLPSCGSASILILDWVNSGRGERPQPRHSVVEGIEGDNEIWAMESYSSVNEVVLGSKLVMRERMLLENQLPPTSSTSKETLTDVAKRLAPYNIYSTILILGPKFQQLLSYLHQMTDKTSQFQIPRPPSVVWSFSPVEAGSGGVLRVAGGEVEDVRKWLRGVLEGGGVMDIVGEGLWPRII